MALFDDTNESRTERPTERRRRQARESGQVARSSELLSAARSLSIWIVLGWWIANFSNAASSWLRTTFQQIGETPHTTDVLTQFREQSWRFVTLTGEPLLLATSTILVAHFLQVGWLWHWSHLAPQAVRLSPVSGLQRLLGTGSMSRLVTIVLKLAIMLTVSFGFFNQWIPSAASSSGTDLSAHLTSLSDGVLQIVSRIALVLLAIGIVDYGWQRWRFERSLLMTRDEVREELKDVEGPSYQKPQLRPFVLERSKTSSIEINQSSLSR